MKNILKYSIMIALLALGAASCKKVTTVDLSASSASFPVGGGTTSFTVTASAPWSISSSASWLLVTPKSGDAGSAVTVSVSVAASSEPQDRTGVITITCEDVIKTFTVTQAQKDAIILSSPTTTISRKGGELKVQLQNNIDYDVAISESWIKKATKADTKGLVSSVESFIVEANESYEIRKAKITFTDKKDPANKAEFEVVQSNNEAIILDAESITMSSDEGTASFNFLTNCEISYTFPDGQDWISVVQPTKALEERTFTIKLKENTGDQREGIVYLTDKNDPEIQDVLKVTQQKKGGEYGQVVTIVRKGMTFTSPELIGDGVTGEIVWGDGNVSAIGVSEVHQFVDEEGKITVNSKGATKIRLKDFTSLDAIDFSIFN